MTKRLDLPAPRRDRRLREEPDQRLRVRKRAVRQVADDRRRHLVEARGLLDREPLCALVLFPTGRFSSK